MCGYVWLLPYMYDVPFLLMCIAYTVTCMLVVTYIILYYNNIDTCIEHVRAMWTAHLLSSLMLADPVLVRQST